MSHDDNQDPLTICERILEERIRYNAEHKVSPRESEVAKRLLARRIELREAYGEVCDKLSWAPTPLKVFFDALLGAATVWSPEEIRAAREDRSALISANRAIAIKAQELADLLKHRSDLLNTSGFRCESHYHVCDVIRAASHANPAFGSFLEGPLDELRYRYDLKYWPTLSQFVRALAIDAQHARVEPADPITAAATEASRPSGADFFKALVTAIEENSTESYGLLPSGFNLSDSAIASFASCVLDLGPEDLVDAAYVKRFRQREREKSRQ